MLQWMGGSRRKVFASRKSTQSRQRQYFEQKKRQQQRPGVQDQVDASGSGTGNQAYHDQAPRSLDVLNLNSLATPNCHNSASQNADSAVPPVDCALLNASPIEALTKVTSVYNSNRKEANSQPRLSSPSVRKDVAPAANPYEEPLGRKISPPKNNSAKKRSNHVELHSEISLFDLVSDEGPKNSSTVKPASESHVSFAVKGLGHIKMETPPQSPISTKRILPLPPKAMRYTQNKARRYIPHDATKKLDSIMSGIDMLNGRKSSEEMAGLFDESGYERTKQFNCYSPHSFENHNGNFFPEDEDMFCEPQAKHGRLDGDPTDDSSERLWKTESFNSEDHFLTPRVEQFNAIDYGFKDRYSPERRTPRTSTRFGPSGIQSRHDLFSDPPLMDNGEDTVPLDWERPPPIMKNYNSNNSFGPSAWSFDMVDDSEKRRSPLSEESCTSVAAIKDGTSKKPSLSVKCEANTMNEKDDFHISFDKLDIPKMDSHLDGSSLFNNLEEYHKSSLGQKNFEAGNWPESDKDTEQQRTREPSCRLSLEEKFANWDSPTSTTRLKGGTGQTNPSSCTVVHEDTSFDHVPDMSTYQTVGSTERRPASKVPPIFQRPENDIFNDDIHLKNPASDIFGDNIEFSEPFCSTDIHSDIDTFLGQKVDKRKEDDFDTFMGQKVDKRKEDNFDTFLGQKVDKRKEDNFDAFKNHNTGTFLAKKSVSSVDQNVVGQHRTCSQQSGKDSLKHGFSPGVDFQESKLNSFWEDGHANNGTFQDLELSGLLARKNSGKNGDKIGKPETNILTETQQASAEKIGKPETKILTETQQASADCRNEMSETKTSFDGSQVNNHPGVQKETSAAAQVPANLGCLQKTSREMFQIHSHVECVAKEKMTHDFDHSKANAMFHSPFVGEEVGIEKKIIASVSPNNSDVQYQVMLEHRVLRRLCVQKIVVDTPTRNKLDKDNHFRVENG